MQVLPEARSFTGCVNSLYSESKVGRNVQFNWPSHLRKKKLKFNLLIFSSVLWLNVVFDRKK